MLKHNLLYGWDPVEQYVNAYIPGFLGGTDVRIGRWIACPDIETQYSVNNYMATHSLLFTFDTYTNTGIMVSQKINDQFMGAGRDLRRGTDMAPWYPGAIPTAAFGFRYVTKDNNDAFYTWANAINSAEFRHFNQYNQPLGHDNFNYVVTTWGAPVWQRVVPHQDRSLLHVAAGRGGGWDAQRRAGRTVRRRRRQRDAPAGPVHCVGRPQLHHVQANEDRDYITVRNEEVYDDEGGVCGLDSPVPTPATRSA